MTKSQHDPRDLAQWLLSRDGDLARLAGRELERALDELDGLRDAYTGAMEDKRMWNGRALKAEAERDGLLRAVTDNHDALSRAEKAEAERDEQIEWVKSLADDLIEAEAVDDSCMDTAHITGHKKGWNEAIEAAKNDFRQFVPEAVFDAKLIVYKLASIKKGADQ